MILNLLKISNFAIKSLHLGAPLLIRFCRQLRSISKRVKPFLKTCIYFSSARTLFSRPSPRKLRGSRALVKAVSWPSFSLTFSCLRRVAAPTRTSARDFSLGMFFLRSNAASSTASFRDLLSTVIARDMMARRVLRLSLGWMRCPSSKWGSLLRI